MLSLEMYGFLRIGYFTNVYIHVEKKNEEVVPFYHMSYLIYFYDIYVTFQKRY